MVHLGIELPGHAVSKLDVEEHVFELRGVIVVSLSATRVKESQ